jgi:Isoleucyl-tRNA synthetase
MLTISTLLFNKSSYKNVLCLGLINDESGQKMSKSKGNVIKPWDILNKQGADALRWYFFTVVSPWNSKNFSRKNVDEVIRKFILTLWNTYSFFVIYANIDDFDPYKYELDVKDRTEIDRWIISELNNTIKKVTELMDDFNVTESGRLIESFVDDLSNWYVRRSRRRFWKGGNDSEKISAYKTLYECLIAISKLSAPYIPFISDEIYKNLTGSLGKGFESVHLEDYPIANAKLIDEELSYKMSAIRKIIGLGRSARSKMNIKTRQPLTKIKLYFEKDSRKNEAVNHFKDIILEELNVKELEITDNLSDFVLYKIKPNLKLLGPKYGAILPAIKDALDKEVPVQLALKVRNEKAVNLIINGRQIELLPEEILVEIINLENIGIESDGEFTVGLPTTLTPELEEEGFSRELVHHIQNLRKEADFKIENTIKTAIACSIDDWKVIEKYSDYIKHETLSREITQDFEDQMYVRQISVNNKNVKVGIIVKGSIV